MIAQITAEEEQEVLDAVRDGMEQAYGPGLITDDLVDWGLMSLVDETYVIGELLGTDGALVELCEVRFFEGGESGE